MVDRTVAEDWHRFIFATDPTPGQARLYGAGSARGFSSRELNEEQVEAVIVLGLLLGDPASKVPFLAPAAHERWLLGQLGRVARLALERAARGKPALLRNRLGGVVQLFHRFSLASRTLRILRITAEPENWVSFGFGEEDYLPGWMNGRLLPAHGAVSP